MEKQQAQNIIRETFESAFDKERFVGFIKNLLKRIEDAPFTYQGQFIPDAYKAYISSLERIGKFSDGESRIDILIVKLQKETSLERARTMQRNFVAWYLNGSRGGELKDAALVTFVSPDATDWRFSLVKMDYKFEQTPTGRMKVKEEFTPARRWSFLVGKNETSHTAQSRLVEILSNDEHSPTFAELEEAFDIETVTKEFFIKYRELFIRTKEELDKLVGTGFKPVPTSLQNEFKSKGVDTVNFAKKLLGQIVFLYFLQKKGWFGVARDAAWGTGSKHFLRELFEKKERVTQAFSLSPTNTNRKQDACGTINFFNDILEPLFYEALRIDRSHDDHYYSRFNCKIPFLNGGLFDPIGSNGGYNWVHIDICLPDSLFSNKNKTKEGDEGDGLLDIFDRYNFTVREDEPLEKEVAIDPELLGKAYEKFNAIRPDNFEEYKKALKSGKKGEESKFNKQYGVYYTPREIVHYMCQQSLINYLHTELTDSNSDRVLNPVRVKANGIVAYQKFGEKQLSMFGNEVKKGQLDLMIKRGYTNPDRVNVSKEDIETLIHFGEQVGENEEIALIKKQKILEGKQKSSDYKVKLPESICKNAILIDQKLADITVCDPAVGSGAFPVGMMSEIVKARNALTVYFKGDGDTDIPVCDNNDTITDRNVCVTTITRRNLPHWTKEGSIYWITFRLADSLPQEKLNIWKDELNRWISKHREPWSETEWKEYDEQFEKRLESWLDSGYGSCVLAQPEVRRIVQECLLRFNEERLQLHAAVIMPNHVHLLLEPLAGNSLSELLKGIKGASSRKINQMLGTTGSKFWMDESYDHIVRSEVQYQRFIRYIAENPVKANLSEDKYWLYQGSTGIPACDQPKDTQTRMSEPDRPQTRMSVPRLAYNFKRHCIEHSLYGVDIDPGAVEIAKLRLWLSLVVDEDDIKNIKPLPNLDYKIVCGNSLLGVEKNLFNNHLFSKLEKIKPLYFNETNPTKKQDYKKQIDELISQITDGHKEFDFEIYFSEVFHTSPNSPLAKGDTGGCRGFDVVIANPPYGAKIDEIALKKIKQNLSDTTNSNSAAIFIDYGKNRLIGEKGTLTFIVPKSLLYSENWFSLVKSMLGNVSILVDVEKAFENVKLEQVVFVYSKSIYTDNYVARKFLDSEFIRTTKIPNDLVLEYNAWICDVSQEELDIAKNLKVECVYMRDISETKRGVGLQKYLSPEGDCPVIGGKNIFRYGCKGIKGYLSKEILKSERSKLAFTQQPKIISQDLVAHIQNPTPRIMITSFFDSTDKIIGLDTVQNTIVTNKEFDYKYILALLNSTFVSWYTYKFIYCSAIRTMHFDNYYVGKIPIPKISHQYQCPVVTFVGQILAAKQEDPNADTAALECQIDQMVYKLYGLTEDEIAIVEGRG